MYIFLERAIKNVGDFLIRDCGKNILNHIKPDKELVELKSFKELDDKIDLLNEAELIIINGGPGYRPNMYPNIYPLVKDLAKIKTPITYLGGGWKAFPGDEINVENFKFSRESMILLRRINSQYGASCRDYLTQRVLRYNGIKNVTMTGCPVWYNIDHIGKKLKVPKKIEKVVYTTPANEMYSKQSLDIIDVLKQTFESATKYCIFHRGIKKDEHTSASAEERYKMMAKKAKECGFIVKDVSYDTKKLEFYKECDLHVGYRVHAHLYFLAHRLPSILIEEDGRGRGANETLGLPRFPGWKRNLMINNIPNNFKRHFNYRPFVSADPLIPQMVKNILNEEIENDFRRIKNAPKIIDDTFKDMKKYVNNFP